MNKVIVLTLFFKQCPVCNIFMYYTNKYNLKKSIIKNATCRSCSHKDHKVSEECKQNLSIRMSGKSNPFYGKKHTEETKTKLSKIQTGRIWSEESKKKSSDSHKGKSLTQEHRDRIGIAHKGKLVSEETKKKLRGRIVTEETKEKLRQARIGWHLPESGKRKLKEYFRKLRESKGNSIIFSRRQLGWWSIQVKRRDNFVCQICLSEKHLHAHHIFPKVQYPEYGLNVSNGITLCITCHKDVHDILVLRDRNG